MSFGCTLPFTLRLQFTLVICLAMVIRLYFYDSDLLAFWLAIVIRLAFCDGDSLVSSLTIVIGFCDCNSPLAVYKNSYFLFLESYS